MSPNRDEAMNTIHEIEDEIRVLARIEAVAAKREIEWIAGQLERLRVERQHQAKREEQLLSDRGEALRRLREAEKALK